MSACIGSEAAGARTLTATSSAGLALMWEELLLAASNRMPIALTLVNRTLSGPININCDHTDGMGALIPDGFRFMQKTIRKYTIILFRHTALPSIKMSACRL